MSEKFIFEFVSPENLILSKEVQEVIVPGSEGAFTVLSGHAPVISSLKPGILTIIEDENVDSVDYFVLGGFADVSSKGLTILAENAILRDELSNGFLDEMIKNSEAEIIASDNDITKRRFQEKVDQLKEIQNIL